jgi:hypothetical protein
VVGVVVVGVVVGVYAADAVAIAIAAGRKARLAWVAADVRRFNAMESKWMDG